MAEDALGGHGNILQPDACGRLDKRLPTGYYVHWRRQPDSTYALDLRILRDVKLLRDRDPRVPGCRMDRQA